MTGGTSVGSKGCLQISLAMHGQEPKSHLKQLPLHSKRSSHGQDVWQRSAEQVQ